MKFARWTAVAALMLVGCAQEPIGPGSSDVPRDAIAVKEGTGRLFFRAIDSGTAYVLDGDTATLLLSQPLQPQQRLIIDAAAGRVTVEGRTLFADPKRVPIKIGDKSITELTINPRHTYRIYFSPGAIRPTTQP